MPELPEVETTVRTIRPRLVGRRFTRAHVSWTGTLGASTVTRFARRVVGTRVRTVRRRAKWILIELERHEEDAGALCVHLRMTGRLRVDPVGEPAGRWERARLDLDDGSALRFVDPRKFGRILHVDDAEAFLRELGPEPLGAEFTRAWLAQALRGRRRALKPLLLDQTFLAGLGNIYVDESLHRARIHPRTRADRLRAPQVAALWTAIRAVLGAAVARRARPSGERRGGSRDPFHVYDRAGRPCPRCGTPIRRVVVGQRSTHFCPRCQRGPAKATDRSS